jgi:NAD(P)-dependent dehydrogenase (short-subunit alcohol dehydrogenase family)
MLDSAPCAIVAGIGPGLGAALCRELAAAGYRVAGLARRASGGEALLETLGPERFLSLPCDLADAAQVDAAVTEAEDRFGPPGVYVHNAASLHMQPFLETEPGDFESLWRTACLRFHAIAATDSGAARRRASEGFRSDSGARQLNLIPAR